MVDKWGGSGGDIWYCKCIIENFLILVKVYRLYFRVLDRKSMSIVVFIIIIRFIYGKIIKKKDDYE